MELTERQQAVYDGREGEAKARTMETLVMYGRTSGAERMAAIAGELVRYCAAAMKRQAACLLISRPIDSLAAAGAVPADVWTDSSMAAVYMIERLNDWAMRVSR